MQNLSLLLERLLPEGHVGLAAQQAEDLSELETLAWRHLFGSVKDHQPLLPGLRPRIFEIEACNPRSKEQPVIVRPRLQTSQISAIC